MYLHREKAMWRHRGHVQTQERLQEKPTLLTPWSWASSLQTYENTNFCCLEQGMFSNGLENPLLSYEK